LTSCVSDVTAVKGVQRPRLEWIPPAGRLSDAGLKAADLAASAGLVLDDWQQYVVDQSLRRGADGKWAAFEVCLIVSRQNGKGTILEALELAGLFLDDRDGFGDERLILHSAHEFKTCSEHFRRILMLIENSPLLRRQVENVYLQRGAESIELKNGKRLRFVARSKSSGRGFTGDRVILDEAQILGSEAMEAILPTLSARPNPQVIYTATAGTPDSTQLGKLRRRGIAGDDPSLAFFEWSAEDWDDPAAEETWAKANPGLGIRITSKYVARERATLSDDGFARERLSVGDYPAEGGGWLVVSEDAWKALEDPRSRPLDPVAFAVEVGPGRRTAAIGAAGLRPDGRTHVEILPDDYRSGTEWVPARLSELVKRWRPCAVVLDPGSHAGALAEAVEQAGTEIVRPFSARDAAQACSQFIDAVTQEDIRHLGQGPLSAALAGAATRPLGDAWAWDRKNAHADISPLTAVTLALWGFNRFGRSRIPHYDLLRSVG
jgi:hypothetical protein